MVRKLVDKPYCSGTLSTAGFFGLIRSALRRLSLRWKPRGDFLAKIRRPYSGTDRRIKWEYPCQECKGWYPLAKRGNDRNGVEVEHIIPAGSLKSWEDIVPFIQRLLIEVDGYQSLCRNCHQKKTNKERE